MVEFDPEGIIQCVLAAQNFAYMCIKGETVLFEVTEEKSLWVIEMFFREDSINPLPNWKFTYASKEAAQFFIELLAGGVGVVGGETLNLSLVDKRVLERFPEVEEDNETESRAESAE